MRATVCYRSVGPPEELEGIEPADVRFLEVLARLERVLRQHVSDEEDKHFPELRAHLSLDQLTRLGRKVENAKKAAPTRPHPTAPHSELFHELVGPGVGMVDRLRDRLTGRSNSV